MAMMIGRKEAGIRTQKVTETGPPVISLTIQYMRCVSQIPEISCAILLLGVEICCWPCLSKALVVFDFRLPFTPLPPPFLYSSLALLDRSSNFARDLPWLRSVTSLPIIIKGVLSPEDAVAAAEAGSTLVEGGGGMPRPGSVSRTLATSGS